jgi:L-iditol 2-dehydrogenase
LSTLVLPEIMTMRAAVYVGNGSVEVQAVPVPEIGPGELLVRVEACGICHTDLKKVEHDLLPPPRIYGHEMAGVVVQAGEGVSRFLPGDRVVVLHHIPCRNCFYCDRKLYAQCESYKRVGVTAGFDPAGGGFSQYIRVMDWIVREGVIAIPDGVSFEQASFVEPVNTCHKAAVAMDPQPGDVVLIQGQGPIGLIFSSLVARTGATVVATDTIPERLALSRDFGATEAVDPRTTDVPALLKRLTGGRGADQVFIAASVHGIVDQAMAASRPGGRILLFAQTSDTERIELSGAGICKLERVLLGVYSASIDLQAETARLVFTSEVPVNRLISHRLPLDQIREGIRLALHPDAKSLKIMVLPQRLSA